LPHAHTPAPGLYTTQNAVAHSRHLACRPSPHCALPPLDPHIYSSPAANRCY
jgi:hypothetical protein